MKLFCEHFYKPILVGWGTKGVWLCEKCGKSKPMSRFDFCLYFWPGRVS